jgi:hypothetical protein
MAMYLNIFSHPAEGAESDSGYKVKAEEKRQERLGTSSEAWQGKDCLCTIALGKLSLSLKRRA